MLKTIVAAVLIGTPLVLATPAQAQPCLEDQACWDCETMGNRICGPGLGSALGRFPLTTQEDN